MYKTTLYFNSTLNNKTTVEKMRQTLEYFGIVKSQKQIDMESRIIFLKCSQINNLVCAQLSGRMSERMKMKLG